MLYINTTMLGAGGGICHRVGQADSKTAPDGGGGVEADGPPSPPSKSSRGPSGNHKPKVTHTPHARAAAATRVPSGPRHRDRGRREGGPGAAREASAPARAAPLPGRLAPRHRRPWGRGGGLRPVGGVQPRPRVRLPAAAPGPGRRGPTHRKGPDPHLGVLPAARAFAQIRHGARPLPGGGGGGGCCGSHSEAPVSH